MSRCRGGTRYDVPIQGLFDMAAEGPADTGNYKSRILSLTQLGDVATATVLKEGQWGTVSFVDFLSLCRVEGTWKTVIKTFCLHRRGTACLEPVPEDNQAP